MKQQVLSLYMEGGVRRGRGVCKMLGVEEGEEELEEMRKEKNIIKYIVEFFKLKNGV